jgi:23S rRNA pseudoU1915 N3-methylase RlmH
MEYRILSLTVTLQMAFKQGFTDKDEKRKNKKCGWELIRIHEQKDAKYKAETAQLAAEDAMQAKQQF